MARVRRSVRRAHTGRTRPPPILDSFLDDDGLEHRRESKGCSRPVRPSCSQRTHASRPAPHGSQSGTISVLHAPSRLLLGNAARVKGNGLGFDSTRVGSLADMSDKWIEPVVEVLAFFGLSIFPVRGPGVERRSGRHGRSEERQRGWRRVPKTNGRRQFVWPAWQRPLDVTGVDALLDAWNPWHKRTWPRLRVHAAWRSVEYEARGKADPTRAIGSEML